VKSQAGDVVLAAQFAQHVIRADAITTIQRMQQARMVKENAQAHAKLSPKQNGLST
jgi:hypothetical protein